MSNIDLIPNCLPRARKIDWNLSRNGQTWLYLYCANCGADGGRVLECEIPNKEEFAFYLCDSCAEKHGSITGTMMVPDEIIWAEIAAEQKEKEQRCLSIHLL